MRKSLESFASKLQEGKNFKLKGGYKVLANLRGGVLQTNSGTCPNSAATCSGTNSGTCTNSNDCSKSTNSGTCTNSGGPGCCPTS